MGYGSQADMRALSRGDGGVRRRFPAVVSGFKFRIILIGTISLAFWMVGQTA